MAVLIFILKNKKDDFEVKNMRCEKQLSNIKQIFKHIVYLCIIKTNKS
jgi:hypothetical protein